VIDADLDAERPWFATEYVDGPTLQQAVRRSGALRRQALHTFALGVAEALDAIHDAGVVHRDLKPSNVLLARNAPKVIDFGIARALDTVSLTQTGKVIGTVTWLAPEQLRSDRASPLSDVFAWGGLVAYAATGRPPFGTGPAEVVVHRILNEDADLGDTEGELRAMVELALAKDPQERPAARALLARLLGAGTRKADAAAAASRVVKDTWTGGSDAWQQAAGSSARPGAAPARQPADGPATPAAPAPATDRPGASPPGAPPIPAGGAGELVGAAGVALDGAGNPVRPAAPPTQRPDPRRPDPAPQGDGRPAGTSQPPALPQPSGTPQPAARSQPAGTSEPAGTSQPAPPVPGQPSGAGPAAGRDAGKGRVLADWLPGGRARDLLLVFGLAMTLTATMPAVRPSDGAPVPPALLILVVGAALLGPLRGAAGFILAVLATEATVHGDALAFLDRPRAIAWYAALALVVVLVGRLASGRPRPLRLLVALATGYGLVYLGLVVAKWVADGGQLAGRLGG
jgi:hypothetical protein